MADERALAEALLRDLLAHSGLTLEQVVYADDDIFADYEHIVVCCKGAKPVSSVLLRGDLSDRDAVLKIAARVIERIEQRRRHARWLERIGHPGRALLHPLPATS